MRLLLILFLFCTLTSLGQDIYKKDKNETIESFINKNFPETKNNLMHKIIVGKWGDSSCANKIVAFYRIPGSDDEEGKAIVLQLISSNKYKKLKFDYSFGIGAYYYTSTIESVFFYDIDDNGFKELIVIEKGAIRCSADVVEYNEETKKYDTITMSSTCDLCGYKIYEQKGDSENIEEIDSAENYEWQCDYKTIKEILDNRKKR